MANEERMRTLQRRRRQRKLAEQWDPTLNDWHKYAKCELCRRRFVVNNYPDRKVRVSKHKVGGVILCPWCYGRDGKFVVMLLKIAEGVTEMEDPKCTSKEGCKCLPCISRRVLTRHEQLPVRN